MLYPSIDKLLEKTDSKYLLVVAASRRARVLRDGAKSQIRTPRSHKNVGVALEELYQDYIRVEKSPKESVK
ncbi:DNA-directed RNA polymerase subunit omega [Paenibacillus thermotolerans]|uniref:DNA-directed RNA polymerase subunit omega n=1 Tax=Paenibacillus thermotolerans TaxID=3027807 RepID=UPI0023686C05|nr:MULTISPECIES: DNA-directed RNA polymerase subunit omega [unclassified Paenibacillus]